MAESKGMGIVKAIIITILILVVCAGIVIGLGKLGFSAWILMLPIFFFLSVEYMNFAAIPGLIVGGLVGLTLGFGLTLSNIAFSFFGQTGQLVALIVYLVLMIFAITCSILQKLEIAINKMTWILVIILSMVPGAADPKYLLQDYGLFIAAAIICAIAGYAIKQASSKPKKTDVAT